MSTTSRPPPPPPPPPRIIQMPPRPSAPVETDKKQAAVTAQHLRTEATPITPPDLST